MEQDIIISNNDWSLYRKAYSDQERHKEKIKEAIAQKLPEIISEEAIITSDGQKTIKIPIRSLNEYKIRYSTEQKKYFGIGDGTLKEGDVIAEHKQSSDSKKARAGEEEGSDYYEAEIELTDIEDVLFKQLRLPNIKDKNTSFTTADKMIFNDIRKQGLIGNIDKKRTLLSALKRNALRGKRAIAPITEEDLRYKTWNIEKRPQANAVVIAMMDTSGSMGSFEKMIARSFFFWMKRFLELHYEFVTICYIAHHTKAKIVTEKEFFYKGEGGGTLCSSAYKKALQIIDEQYSPEQYNIYAFHFTDGDNLSSDYKTCLDMIEQLLQKINMFGYGEINPHHRYSTLMGTYRHITSNKFRHYILREKTDIYYTLRRFFRE